MPTNPDDTGIGAPHQVEPLLGLGKVTFIRGGVIGREEPSCVCSQFSGYEGRRCSCCSLVCGCCMENDNQNAGPDALPAGQYETGTIDFNPAAQRPYSGCTLELRYAPVDIPIMEPHLRADALV